MNKEDISLRPMEFKDIDRVYRWRNKREIYKYFKHQTGDLDWETHVDYWLENLDKGPHYIILYYDVPIGKISVKDKNEMSIIIGEKRLWGKGIGSISIELFLDKHDYRKLYATIHKDNISSIRLFRKYGFKSLQKKGDYLKLIRESDNDE